MTAKQIKVEILLSVNLGDYYNESVNHRKDLKAVWHLYKIPPPNKAQKYLQIPIICANI